MTAREFVLTLACRDTVGIVAATSGFLASQNGFILESQQFADAETNRFFMRVAFRAADTRNFDSDNLREAFTPIAAHFGMDWQLADASKKLRIVIAVSRFGHCLNDLLHRWRIGSLQVDIAAVISNHTEFRSLTEWHGLPFRHWPVDAANRDSQEAALLDLMDDTGSDLLVLARYMQVLSPTLCEKLAWRCINIHHSFLPSFRGAKPYHQAHARGVKLIGATAHFVTPDLDEGPIIEQAIERVDHGTTVERMVATGRDVESIVLARAVNWAAERRILPNGSKTVVFRR